MLSQARKEAHFWWTGSDKDRGIHWRSWELLCGDKLKGGMGFKDLGCMNLALLAKHGWRIVTRQASLVYKGRQVLHKGTRWRVGDGKSINIWKYPWVSRSTDFYHRGPRDTEFSRVSQLINNGQLDLEKVSKVLGNDVAKQVVAIPLSRHHIRNFLKSIW
ncbi:hypothetical protein LIER_36556 [Lithospermum erythrorhizon]|uniref:Uncharacterized protein n=1 Tax=Lithospermum erythrorhizon TaxID=34254 RepID=A0AAV3P834_LITER